MNPFPKMLIGLGVLLVVIGLVWQFGSRFIPLGKLPGDIYVEKENFRFYFPLATSILLSVVLSLLLLFFRRFGGR